MSLLPTLTLTLSLAAISRASPVCGLRPVRAARCVFSKAIHPGMVTFVPSATDFETTEKNASTTPLTAAWLWPDSDATAATSSVRFSDLSAM
ncbi:hypothetical protein ASG05_09715 [Frigoribacterium sp. Leaf186]|nr:hypothetical protein ASG05_09715 [Frigoribacterium sp. Leaf186]